MGCGPGEVYFTSGGTEANNLAIRGVAAANQVRRHILTSVIEHPATIGPCDWLAQHGYSVSRAPVDGVGRVVTERAQEFLGQETALVTIMHANSETGTLQPINEIAELARAAFDAQGIEIHTGARVLSVTTSDAGLGAEIATAAGITDRECDRALSSHGWGANASALALDTPARPIPLGAV